MMQDAVYSFIVPWLLMFLCGLTLKWTDDISDKTNQLTTQSWVFGIGNALVCGLGMAWVAASSEQWVLLVFGIIVAVLVTGKVDSILLWFGFLVVVLAWLLFGGLTYWMPLSWLWILVVALGGIIDEIGHSLSSDSNVNKWIRWFFEYRWTLRVWVIILVVVGFLSLDAALGVWWFDIGYLLSGVLFDRYLGTKLSVSGKKGLAPLSSV